MSLCTHRDEISADVCTSANVLAYVCVFVRIEASLGCLPAMKICKTN